MPIPRVQEPIIKIFKNRSTPERYARKMLPKLMKTDPYLVLMCVKSRDTMSIHSVLECVKRCTSIRRDSLLLEGILQRCGARSANARSLVDTEPVNRFGFRVQGLGLGFEPFAKHGIVCDRGQKGYRRHE